MKRLIGAALLGGTLLVSGCSATGTSDMKSADESSESSSPKYQDETPEEESEPEAQVVDKSNVVLKIRETRKQCYGYGVGCSVDYKVVPALQGLDVSAGFAEDYDITYEVRGGTGGPTQDTFVLYTSGDYDVPYEGFADTSSKSVKLKAVVTAVTPVNE